MRWFGAVQREEGNAVAAAEAARRGREGLDAAAEAAQRRQRGRGTSLPTLTRRAFLRFASVALAVASLAACAGSGSSPSPAEADAAVASVLDEDDAKELPTVFDTTSSGDDTVATSELARLLGAGEVGSIRLIGDSITAGYACDGYGATTDRVIYDGPYGYFFESAPEVGCWANDFRTYATEHGVADFANAGVSGAKMRWLAEDPAAWIGEGADVIFVMLGTNDAAYFSPEEFRSDAELALAAVADACNMMVVLSPPTNERSDAANLYGPDVIDQVLSDICSEHSYLHVSLLDALELYTDDFNPDQCHPTTFGSHKLWDHLRAALGL